MAILVHKDRVIDAHIVGIAEFLGKSVEQYISS
jgi:hypothetical protein